MAVNPDNKYKSSHVGSVIDEAVGYALNIPDIQNDVASLESKVAPLNGVPAQLQAHINDTDNPHSVTKAQVGLGNVNNTSDADKPVSSATQAALDEKVDKQTGMGLSQNSYTTTEKNKLSGIESGAEVNVIESVKVNGVALPVSSKAVNVDLSTYAKTSDLNNVVRTTGKDSQTIAGDISIQGDLTVQGTTTTQDTETLMVKDNIIVTNSDGVALGTALSGMFIKTSGNNGYAIAYVPGDDKVILGSGTIDSTGEVTIAAAERNAIVTRPDSETFENGAIVAWDAENNTIIEAVDVSTGQTIMTADLADIKKDIPEIRTDISNIVSNPTASGTGKVFIDSIVRNGAGDIVVSRKTVSITSDDVSDFTSAVNAIISNATIQASKISGTVAQASHAASADSATNATKLNGQAASYYATKASVDDVNSSLNDTITQIKDGDIVAGQATSANLASTAQTAAQLSASRTISLNGDVTASVSFNGTTNVSDTVDTSKIIQSITVGNEETCTSVINKVINKYKSTGSNLFSFNTGGIYSGLGIYLQTDGSIYFIGDGDGSPYAGYIYGTSTQWGTAIEQLGVLYSKPYDGIPLTDLAQNVQNLITGAGNTVAIINGDCSSSASSQAKTITLDNAPDDWYTPYKYIFAIKYNAENTAINCSAVFSNPAKSFQYIVSGKSMSSSTYAYVAGRGGQTAYYYIDDINRINWIGDTATTDAQFTNDQVKALMNVATVSSYSATVSAGGRSWSVSKIGFVNGSSYKTLAISTMNSYYSVTTSDEAAYNITLPVSYNTTYANAFLTSEGNWKNWEQVGAYQLWLSSSTNARLTVYSNDNQQKRFKITVIGII